MAFNDIRLPIEVERGAVGGPGFKTTVLQLESGFEQRNVDWSQIRGEWDISYGLMNMDNNGLQTAVEDILHFFIVNRGKGDGWRFKDWSDYRIGTVSNPTNDNQRIGLGDDAQTVFQVFKQYSFGGLTYDRTLKKLVSGQVVVLLDNVVQGSGFTIDLTLATITFSVAPASTGGTGPGGEVSVEVALEFDIPVRFDEDRLKISVETSLAGQIPPIPIIELRRKPGIA